MHCYSLLKVFFPSLRILSFTGGFQDPGESITANGASHCPFDNDRPARCTRLQSAASGLSAGWPVTPARGQEPSRGCRSHSAAGRQVHRRYGGSLNFRHSLSISPAAGRRGFAAGPRAESSDSAFIFQPKNEKIPFFVPRPAELRAVAGFTPCYHDHIGRKTCGSCYTFRRLEYKGWVPL
jgi:hypothetical protein